MAYAGRTIVFSGLVVSLGLALMLLLPVPFLRGFGVGAVCSSPCSASPAR